jgi:6-phosphogluconate dehydrogenase
MQSKREGFMSADIGLIGLAVMGQNLALNMNDHGYRVVVYNRTSSKVDEFLNDAAKGSAIVGAHTVSEFIKTLKRPRRMILMVKAGAAVDALIDELLPYLEKGDILVDGGNSLFTDTNRRVLDLKEKGIVFVGAGISGGEEGARHGPSIMPGGNSEGWAALKPIFQGISAKVNGDEPCSDWVGDAGSGHYVKMVHNGIEYGDMQLISEAYQLLKNALHLDAGALQKTFQKWNQGSLDSYLIEITADIFGYKDVDGLPLVEKILDVAGQKGTGKWTVNNALDLGMPLTLIGEAVFARCLSALKEDRLKSSEIYSEKVAEFIGDKEAFINAIKDALYASKIVSYAQGFMLIQEASKEYKWNIDFGAVALMWRGGCIIRSKFLQKIKEAYDRNPKLTNLLLDPFFEQEIKRSLKGWRQVVSKAAEMGIASPCFSTALCFFDGFRTAKLPANLLQAQRDYFGAHTYERIDKPRGTFFHTNWTGKGGDVSSSTYNV